MPAVCEGMSICAPTVPPTAHAQQARPAHRVEGGARVTRIYDRYNYDAEKGRALETWALTLKSIVESEEPGKVLPFSASVNR
jgi:hypothetical protein